MRQRPARPSSLSPDVIARLDAQLREHRRALELRVRHARSTLRGDGAPRRAIEGVDGADAPDTDAQEDLPFALLQAHGEMMARIDDALQRLEAGRYECCRECGRAIGTAPRRAAVRHPLPRLRARSRRRRRRAAAGDSVGHRHANLVAGVADAAASASGV